MTRRALYIVALAVIATSQLAARDAVNVTSCINNDTLSTIKIIEPAALSLRVAREGETLQYQGISDLVAEEDAHSDQSNQSTNRVAGYRVQVFLTIISALLSRRLGVKRLKLRRLSLI